jgi:spermidine synthase
MQSGEVSRPARLVLLASIFLVAACGLVYELVAGAVSSYLMGDAVTQFSFVIGVFLSAMGLGSWLAQFITGRLPAAFVALEIWLGLLGGLSSVLMFAASALAPPVFPVFFYSLCAVLGCLIGAEIPLLVRILKDTEGVSRAVSSILALDYLGALAGSVLFPLVVLPFLGLSRASGVFGVMNLAVAWAGLAIVPPPKKRLGLGLAAASAVLAVTLVCSGSLVGFFEDLLYQDSIIFAKTSPYQRIILTRWRGDVRLYLEGQLQFSSVDEARYHESLVFPAMAARPGARSVLILGGGDGLAAREVLKFPGVETITVVDIDPAVTELAKTRPELRALNQRAFLSPRVRCVNMDAMRYLETSRDFYDVILADLPDPDIPALAKLYSTSFYALAARRLSRHGVFCTQATSPFYAPRAFWSIVRTLRESAPSGGPPGLVPLPYHVNVPSFGEWGFVLAAREHLDPARLRAGAPARFHTDASLRAMFVFPLDMAEPQDIQANRLQDPVLPVYYRKGWDRFNQ